MAVTNPIILYAANAILTRHYKLASLNNIAGVSVSHRSWLTDTPFLLTNKLTFTMSLPSLGSSDRSMKINWNSYSYFAR